MCRKFHYFGFLVVVAAIVMVGLTSVSRADIITTSQITGDSDCGVDSSYAYTCAVNLCNLDDVSVNGVPFEPTSFSDVETGSGANWSISTPGAVLYTWAESMSVTGEIEKVVRNDNHSSEKYPIIVTFTGLTPGEQYVASFFGHTSARDRTQDLTTTTHAGAFRFNEDEFGDYTGQLVTVKYTAPGDGVWAATFTKAVNDEGYLACGFANYLVPEPSTLALLATGLIGLLCYAWRKQK